MHLFVTGRWPTPVDLSRALGDNSVPQLVRAPAMHVPIEVKARVAAKLQESIVLLESHYNRKFDFPSSVVYDVSGTIAGKAHTVSRKIDFNAALLMRNQEVFINRTVPHEMAHLADYQMNPQNFYAAFRQKRDLHGQSWQSIMQVLKVEDISRCHTYDVTGIKRESTRESYVYKCESCIKEYKLSVAKHNKLQSNPHAYRCKCSRIRGMLTLISTQLPPMKLHYHTPPTNNAPSAGSKLDKCWSLYKSYQHTGRGALIAMFVNEASCTPAGAATYYSSLKKKYEAGVI